MYPIWVHCMKNHAESTSSIKLQASKEGICPFRWAVKCKAPAKRSQHANTGYRNIVGRNMLVAFGRHVAMCCDMLGVVGSNLTSFKLEPATPNMSQQGGQTCATCCTQQCWDMLRWMLRSFGRGLTLSKVWSVSNHYLVNKTCRGRGSGSPTACSMSKQKYCPTKPSFMRIAQIGFFFRRMYGRQNMKWHGQREVNSIHCFVTNFLLCNCRLQSENWMCFFLENERIFFSYFLVSLFIFEEKTKGMSIINKSV